MNEAIEPASVIPSSRIWPFFGFLVVEQGVDVDRLVELADAGINSDGAEKRFHAEGARFVRNDGHDQLADFRIAQHFSQHADEGHGGGNFASFAAVRNSWKSSS